ncbi:MAG: ATP-binding protein [Desulfobacterales bacterium]|jgi:DNA transposition AAA+ family ATPase|nr:ATP-binding protein [Desulfobacterales bacterium]
MKPVQFQPTFVKTKNVRNFAVMMDGLSMADGEGRLGLVSGPAGRGKTRTSQWYQAHHDCVYQRMATIWRHSETDFLQALCREVGILTPPKRKGPCYMAVIDALIERPRPVFLDEIDKLPDTFIDLVRDLSDMSLSAFVLVGEERLPEKIGHNKRGWSRVYQQIEFQPIHVSDIMLYALEATGLKLSPQVAQILHGSSKGDFRLVRRDTLALVQICNAKQTTDVTEEMATIATKAGLHGR